MCVCGPKKLALHCPLPPIAMNPSETKSATVTYHLLASTSETTSHSPSSCYLRKRSGYKVTLNIILHIRELAQRRNFITKNCNGCI